MEQVLSVFTVVDAKGTAMTHKDILSSIFVDAFDKDPIPGQLNRSAVQYATEPVDWHGRGIDGAKPKISSFGLVGPGLKHIADAQPFLASFGGRTRAQPVLNVPER